MTPTLCSGLTLMLLKKRRMAGEARTPENLFFEIGGPYTGLHLSGFEKQR